MCVCIPLEIVPVLCGCLSQDCYTGLLLQALAHASSLYSNSAVSCELLA